MKLPPNQPISGPSPAGFARLRGPLMGDGGRQE
jgi:hypothetical protein